MLNQNMTTSFEQTTPSQPHRADLPSISLITPTYNYGRFISKAIESVFSQGYPHLEYMIFDGGSTDDTLEVIRQYKDRITFWQSQPDSGPAEAIERGRQRCSGELFNWLNADDYLLPDALISVGTIARKYPQFDMYTFLSYHEFPDGTRKLRFPAWTPKIYYNLIAWRSVFAQEVTFIRSDFLKQHNIRVRADFKHVFDTILYEEMLHKGARVLLINKEAGVMVHHPAAKTWRGVPQHDLDIMKVWRRTTYSLRQQIWRRISGSRFAPLLYPLYEYSYGRKLIALWTGKTVQKSAFCWPISLLFDQPETWELLVK
jgi:glycosyltransferase involved in cell wall biosynthesis